MGRIDGILDEIAKHYGYSDAVFLKNAIIGVAGIFVGSFVATYFSCFFGAIIDVDHKHKLEDEEISMLILEKKGKKTRILLPYVTRDPREMFLNIFIFFLHKIGILKGSRVMKKDVKRAKFFFSIILVIGLAITMFSFHEIFSVQDGAPTPKP